jgi:hypothetical protein
MNKQREYSDSLLALALTGNRAKYRESKVEIANPAGETFKTTATPTEIARDIAFALAVGLQAAQKAQDEGEDLS